MDLKGVPNLVRAYETLEELFPSRSILIASPPEHAMVVRDSLAAKGTTYELLLCQTTDPNSFLEALTPYLKKFESFFIHDASRPLTSLEQMERVLSAFTKDVDAVRPAIAFTETLKILGDSSQVIQTLDRTSVRRVSSPEMIRCSMVEVGAKDESWFLPLQNIARREYIEGTPLGQRINTSADRDLMELFLD